jgi:hypothetical protein
MCIFHVTDYSTVCDIPKMSICFVLRMSKAVYFVAPWSSRTCFYTDTPDSNFSVTITLVVLSFFLFFCARCINFNIFETPNKPNRAKRKCNLRRSDLCTVHWLWSQHDRLGILHINWRIKGKYRRVVSVKFEIRYIRSFKFWIYNTANEFNL